MLLSVITHPGSFSFPSLGELSSPNPQVLQGLESCQPPAAQDLKETWAHFHNLEEQTNKKKKLKKQMKQIQNRKGKSSVLFSFTATFIPHKKKKSLETKVKMQAKIQQDFVTPGNNPEGMVISVQGLIPGNSSTAQWATLQHRGAKGGVCFGEEA